MILPALLLGVLAQNAPSLEAVRKCFKETARVPYSYRVTGRFSRTGVYAPPSMKEPDHPSVPATLTARIGPYVSVRRGARLLVKGPEGLWKTPDERLGEAVAHPHGDAADIVRTLREARPPHELLQEYLDKVRPVGAGEERELDGVPCRAYVFAYLPDPLRVSIQKQIDRSSSRGALDPPERILWNTAAGRLLTYVHRETGVLVRFTEERSVRIAYRKAEGERKPLYRLELFADCFDHGTASAEVPREVEERLNR